MTNAAIQSVSFAESSPPPGWHLQLQSNTPSSTNLHNAITPRLNQLFSWASSASPTPPPARNVLQELQLQTLFQNPVTSLGSAFPGSTQYRSTMPITTAATADTDFSSNMYLYGNAINAIKGAVSTINAATTRNTDILGTDIDLEKKKARKKRGKRGGRKPRQLKTNEFLTINGAGTLMETQKMKELDQSTNGVEEEKCVTKRNLINAIELERRNHELTKLQLVQLHEYYGKNIKHMKQVTSSLQQKLTMYQNTPSETDLHEMSQQKQELRDSFRQKKAMRLRDEKQIKRTNKENQKLTITIHHLRQQLMCLKKQYHVICNEQQTETVGKKDVIADKKTVPSLDSVDDLALEAADASAPKDEWQQSQIQQQVDDSPWFQRIIEDNKMLERHVRLLRHLIEQETQRCHFREMIVNKKILSPSQQEKNRLALEKTANQARDQDDEKCGRV
eukprot:CAMPEP_0202703252 /NCGR_PEP_ID=MMETSP1385-20130828/16110_1 /ASSEMBLY_ACC=CAM_ASM_000861 /TAXON_ID=933848 /ORGANISM="Elphidium margaritaceum" /LENGTH=447 /DNA_ID=CAMNT_0049361073 /DNA_START=318 /DNA_END=1661 /DNA_ORIENTATION=+